MGTSWGWESEVLRLLSIRRVRRSSEFRWVQVSLNGSRWVQGSRSETRGVQMSSSEFRWVQVNPSEIKWAQVSSSESKCIQMSSSDFKRVQARSREFKWVQVSSSESKWVQVSSGELQSSQVSASVSKRIQVSPRELKRVQVSPSEFKGGPNDAPPPPSPQSCYATLVLHARTFGTETSHTPITCTDIQIHIHVHIQTHCIHNLTLYYQLEHIPLDRITPCHKIIDSWTIYYRLLTTLPSTLTTTETHK